MEASFTQPLTVRRARKVIEAEYSQGGRGRLCARGFDTLMAARLPTRYSFTAAQRGKGGVVGGGTNNGATILESRYGPVGRKLRTSGAW